MPDLTTDTAKTEMAILVGIAAVVSLAIATLVPGSVLPASLRTDYVRVVTFRLELFFSTLTLLLLVSQLVIYGRIYRAIPTRFTLGLLLFTLALLCYAVTSNPLVLLAFNLQQSIGPDPFVVVPSAFVAAAVVILQFQSRT